MEWSSDPQFYMMHRSVVPLVTYCNSNGAGQIVVPKSGRVCEILIEELHMTPLAGYLGV